MTVLLRRILLPNPYSLFYRSKTNIRQMYTIYCGYMSKMLRIVSQIWY